MSEPRSGYTVSETAQHYAAHVLAISRRMPVTDRDSLHDVLTLEGAAAFLGRVARDDLSIFAPEEPK